MTLCRNIDQKLLKKENGVSVNNWTAIIGLSFFLFVLKNGDGEFVGKRREERRKYVLKNGDELRKELQDQSKSDRIFFRDSILVKRTVRIIAYSSFSPVIT